ncbi:MAG: hypothetical protein Q9211_004320, partial [Gyalolechia sp. 1 TL-2023]
KLRGYIVELGQAFRINPHAVEFIHVTEPVPRDGEYEHARQQHHAAMFKFCICLDLERWF